MVPTLQLLQPVLKYYESFLNSENAPEATFLQDVMSEFEKYTTPVTSAKNLPKKQSVSKLANVMGSKL